MTVTGVELSVVEPSPSCPYALFPQHLPWRVLFETKAQLWGPAPTATEVAVEIPDTVTGVVLFVVVPLPSCPILLLPQHFTIPADKDAQL